MLTALIVDDEPLARVHLQRLLEQHGIQIVGEAENAALALQLAEDLHPDLLFLDIQMPGLTGMQLASALLYLDRAPMLIFVTGYSEYAVDAFEQDALDYLVKPVAPDRLAKTLVRARERLSNQSERRQTELHVIQRIYEAAPLPRVRPSAQGPALCASRIHPRAFTRLPVRENYTVHLIRVEEIICAIARDKRVFVQIPDGEYRTYYTLAQLETLLPADRFYRLHDSCIVNLHLIERIHFLGNHSYTVQLLNGQQLPVGRTRYAELQIRLGLNL
jgi:two-component system LytT family response regulator